MQTLRFLSLLVVVLFVAAAQAGDAELQLMERSVAPIAPEAEASWYGAYHHGRLTANGEVFDMHGLTAAHRELPFGTRLRVTDLGTGRSVVVRINDRGPYWGARGLDLSYAAASELGIVRQGLARVRMEILPLERQG